MTRPALVWFRNDLRLADNPALCQAAATGGPVIPVYILDDAAAGIWRAGGAARWWLHGSLASLQRDLARLGLPLRLLAGDAAGWLDRLVAESGAGSVHWNRRYEPWAIAQDKAIKAGLERQGIRARSHNGSLGRAPWEVLRGGGAPYNYTPVPDAAGFDAAVTGVRIAPTGVMNGAAGASSPSFTVRFRTRIR